MGAPAKMLQLVEQFERNLPAYKQGRYNETQVRVEFIDPFFEELGWDVANRQGYAEPYKDVVHEDAVRVGGATKAPDYCFRIGGKRQFLLESKKPSLSIHAGLEIRRRICARQVPTPAFCNSYLRAARPI